MSEAEIGVTVSGRNSSELLMSRELSWFNYREERVPQEVSSKCSVLEKHCASDFWSQLPLSANRTGSSKTVSQLTQWL